MPYPIPGSASAFAFKTVTGTNPAANVEISDSVPSGVSWMLYAVSVTLVQGATQTPQPQLIIDDGTNIIFQGFGGSSAQNAGVTAQYTWAPGLTLAAGGAATSITAPLPSGLILPSGYRIRTSTTGKGANTDYGAPSYFVCEMT